MDDRVSDVCVSRALVEQAKRVLEQLQNTDDPHTGKALESPASRDEKAVQLLIERGGADVIDWPNVHGRMPIFSAAGSSARDASKATRLTRQMCEAKCSVNWTDANGCNILHHAVKKPKSGRLEIVQLLLARGANPNEGDHDGVSPAQLARRKGHLLYGRAYSF